MDIKDCKIGTRVVCVKEECGNIPSGALGTIIENKTSCPFVDWDEYFNDSQYEYDGYHNVYAVNLKEIEVLKENTSEEVPSKETNIEKLDGGVVEKGQVLTEQVVLDNLLHHINSAVNNNDEDTALKLSEAYQRIKSVQTI